MGNQNVRERYTILPDEAKDIAKGLTKKGGATTSEIQTIARRRGVAAKVIHTIIERRPGLRVLPDQPKNEGASKRIHRKKPAYVDPLPLNIKRDPEPEPQEVKIDPSDEALALLAEMETALRKEHDARTNVLLGEIEALKNEVEAAQEAADEKEAKAREAIAKTAELRRATAKEREELEELRGNVSVLQRKVDRLEDENAELQAQLKSRPVACDSTSTDLLEENRWMRGQIADMVVQQRKLLDALETSERLNGYDGLHD